MAVVVAPDLTSLERWGNRVVKMLQKAHSKPLDIANQILAFAGLGAIYGLLSTGFFLFWDKEIGLHLVAITLVSAVANLSIKFAYVGPRPYWTDSRVMALECRTEFAFPSGHSSAPTALLGWFAIVMLQRFLQYQKIKHECGAYSEDDDALVRFVAEKEIGGFFFRKCRYVVLIWMFAVGWLILISLSRCYLGAHYPHDMWGGVLIGIGTLLVYRLLIERVAIRRLRFAKFFTQLLFSILAAILSTGLLVGSYFVGLKRGYPAIWQQIAEMQCAGVQIRPKLSSAMMLSGAFTAILTGVVFLYRYADFNAARKTARWKRFVVRPIVFILPSGIVMGGGLLLQKKLGNYTPALLSVSWLGAFFSCFWIIFGAASFCKWLDQRFGRSHQWMAEWMCFESADQSTLNVAAEGGEEARAFLINQTGI